jgi:hypothetical protein
MYNMVQRSSCVLVVGLGCLSMLGCAEDSDTISDVPTANTPTGVLASARLNDTAISSDSPANLAVEFLDGDEPRVTFELSMGEVPAISIVGWADYAFLETGAVEVDVTEALRPGGANLILAGEAQTSGRLKLELSGRGKVTGTLLDADDRLTFDAAVSLACAVPSHLLPDSAAAPVPTSPGSGEVLVHDVNFVTAECQGVRDFLRL